MFYFVLLVLILLQSSFFPFKKKCMVYDTLKCQSFWDYATFFRRRTGNVAEKTQKIPYRVCGINILRKILLMPMQRSALIPTTTSNQGSVSAGTEHQHQFCYFSTPNNADRDRFRSVPSIAILSGPLSYVSKTLFRSLVISDSSLLVAAARCRLHRGSVARSSALLPRVKVSWSAPTTHFIIVTSS